MIDLPLPLWLPPKPAIIRSASSADLALIRSACRNMRKERASFPFPSFGLPTGPAPTLTYRTQVSSGATNNTTFTFSSLAIGTAVATRQVILGIVMLNGAGSPPSSVTIGGIAATQDYQEAAPIVGWRAMFYRAIVPTGTTATVIVTFAATGTPRLGVGVWTVDRLFFNGPTGRDFDEGTTSASMSLPVTEGGFVVAISYSNNSPAVAWTGATESYEANTGSGTTDHSGAEASGLSQRGAHALSVSSPGSANLITMACSYR